MYGFGNPREKECIMRNVLVITKNPSIPGMESTFTQILIGLEIEESHLWTVAVVASDTNEAMSNISSFYFVPAVKILKWLAQNYPAAEDRFWRVTGRTDMIAIHKDVCEIMER
jgi:hypothetical protein